MAVEAVPPCQSHTAFSYSIRNDAEIGVQFSVIMLFIFD